VTGRQRGKLELAKLWLVEQLAYDPVTTKELKAAAEAEGHSWRTVQRAAQELGIEERRNADGPSTWSLLCLAPNSGATAQKSQRYWRARALEVRREAEYRREQFGEQCDRLMRAGHRLGYPELFLEEGLRIDAGRVGWEAMAEELLDHQEDMAALDQFLRLADLATHLAMAQEGEG
jgi:hypothetical protein